MKKIILIIILIFLTTGCSSYTELNDLSIVNTLGIDYQNEKYILNLSTIEKDLETTNKNVNIFTSRDKDLNKAFENIYLTSKKRLYLSHINLLILTKEAIDNKLNEILNNFLNNNEYRNNFYVIIMDNNSFYNFFNPNNNLNSEDITKLIDINTKETALTKKMELESFLKDILIDENSYIPTISYKDKITLKGLTLIKNKKVYKELNNKDTILLNILSNNVNKTYINDINIYENITTINIKKNKIIFDIRILISKNKDNNIKSLTDDLINFLKDNQNNNYDILKLCNKIKKDDYSYYKNTKDLLNKLTFEINIKTKEKENYIEGDIYEK